MKYSEIKNGDKRSKYVDQNDYSSAQIFAAMKENASEAIAAFSTGHAIFKGLFSNKNTLSDIMLSDPKLIERKSQNTSNHYTVLLDNLPSWRNFPKRSRSLICATKKYIASGFGDVFLVLPFDGAKIAVCPTTDIWAIKFEKLGTSLEIFNNIMSKYHISDYDYESVITTILMNRKDILSSTSAEDTLEPTFLAGLAACKNRNDLISLLNDALNPIPNDFELTDIFNTPVDENKEVWTDSKSYLVDIDSSFYQLILEHCMLI